MTERKTRVAGATVTIDPTPSEQIVAAKADVSVSDSTGRTIVLRQPDVLAQFDVVEALGDVAMNQAYMAMVFPILFVISINGDMIGTPSSKAEVRALIKRLGDSGVQAVAAGVMEHFAPSTQDASKNA